ncbi:MAG: sulfur oxidation c-type cytochrome SoxX [Rhodobacteraceae bacterium]|nr:sulfur oxidation c-type cytochrome SoxX [Paracoccaceae bacterium]
MRLSTITAVALAFTATVASAQTKYPTDVTFEDGAIAASLSGTPGDPANGQVLMNKGAGNCIACHEVTALAELPFHGGIGPMLDGAADRWTEADLRGIVADAKVMFPESMMPSFYKISGFVRPGDAYTGKAIDPDAITPLLSAQEIEDVVSFLMTLRDE